MNWLKLVLQITSLVPAVVTSVEQIASTADGATKKQLAMSALGLSSAVAGAVAPQYKEDIDAATLLASRTIDNTVAVYNFIGKFGKSNSAPVESTPATVAPVDHVVSGGFQQ